MENDLKLCSLTLRLLEIINNLKLKSNIQFSLGLPEAATQSCSKKKVFWKYAANLQQNTHAMILFINLFFNDQNALMSFKLFYSSINKIYNSIW